MKLRLFFRFLLAYGLYEEYFDELRGSQDPDCTNEHFLNFLSRLSPDRYVSDSIHWWETSRGSYFWSMVNDAWLNYLKEYTAKN